MAPGLMCLPTNSDAFTSGVRSGTLFSSTGVGTAMTNIVVVARSAASQEKASDVSSRMELAVSLFRSWPFFSSSMRVQLMSKPTVLGNLRAKASATGSPT